MDEHFLLATRTIKGKYENGHEKTHTEKKEFKSSWK